MTEKEYCEKHRELRQKIIEGKKAMKELQALVAQRVIRIRQRLNQHKEP